MIDFVGLAPRKVPGTNRYGANEDHYLASDGTEFDRLQEAQQHTFLIVLATLSNHVEKSVAIQEDMSKGGKEAMQKSDALLKMVLGAGPGPGR